MRAILEGRAMRSLLQRRQQTKTMHFRRMSFNWFARQFSDERTPPTVVDDLATEGAIRSEGQGGSLNVGGR